MICLQAKKLAPKSDESGGDVETLSKEAEEALRAVNETLENVKGTCSVLSEQNFIQPERTNSVSHSPSWTCASTQHRPGLALSEREIARQKEWFSTQ